MEQADENYGHGSERAHRNGARQGSSTGRYRSGQRIPVSRRSRQRERRRPEVSHNAASFGDSSALAFFKASTRNLLAASADAGVGHYIALSVVGTPRLVESDYFHAKMVQENLIRAARRPYTILHSTQFFEFIGGVVDMAADGGFRLPSASIQPIAADNVAEILAELAMGAARNDTIEICGPEQFGLDEIARMHLTANEDTRQVMTDNSARYYGVELNDDTLLPRKGARSGSLRYADWLSMSD
jgi:uncharacterized protein YbjT (DUF2867 family)